MKTLVKFAISAFLLLTIDVLGTAQQPNVSNAKIQEVSATAGLRATVDGVIQNHEAPLWIGYRILVAAKQRSMCCFDSWAALRKDDAQCSNGCRVESAHGISMNDARSACSAPEPPPYAFLFLRTGDQGDKRIREVRVYSADCPLDFGGLPLFWLNDVKPEQSIELLAGLASANSDSEEERERRGPSHAAVMAIALHDSPAADAALEKLIQPGLPNRLRENVAFWLGVERGKRGQELLHKYVKSDPDVRFREKGTFALSQSKVPEALADLIDMARHDSSSRVRGQAIFWLAQIGGRKEAEQITAAIEDDPETEVKKKAVFALSQMHDGEGVPLLIQLARTNRNPAVRKQAIFWLGQSHDPRALDFLEEILTK
jgi:HEAT repeat protein